MSENNSTKPSETPINLSPTEKEALKVEKTQKDKQNLEQWTQWDKDKKEQLGVIGWMDNLEETTDIWDIPKDLAKRIQIFAKNHPQDFKKFQKVIGDISEIMDAQLFKDTFLIAEKDVKIEKITELQNENEKLKEKEDKKEEKNNKKEEKNNKKEETKENENKLTEKEFNTLYKNYKNVANILSWNANAGEFLRLMSQIDKNGWKLNPENAIKLDKAIESIKNPQNLRQIATSLKSESPAKYQTFRKAVSFDPQIATMLDSFEAKSNGVPWKAIVDIHAGVSGVKWVVDGDNVSFDKDGTTINTNKGETTIALNGSDYKMGSEPWEANENLEKAKNVQEENNKKNRLIG